MPIDLAALLQPISSDQPAGADLRYQPVTSQIKEARRQEDNLAQGVWAREIKTADFVQVVKLAREALAKQSKDLQIAAWLTEALLRREGFAGLRQGLELMRGMVETFWDSAYPQIDEDGDLEMRATPLSWVGSQLDVALRSAPITRAGHSWYQYRESRAIPAEPDSKIDPAKMERRNEAIAEGRITPEDFEKGLETTPLEFSQKIYDELGGLLEFVGSFGSFCDAKFKAVALSFAPPKAALDPQFTFPAPDFAPLKATLEEIQQTARLLLIQKGGLRTPEPEAEQAEEPIEEAGASEAAFEASSPQPVFAQGSSPTPAAGAAPKPKRTVAAGVEPANEEDAIERLLAVARFLRRANPFSPMPYLIPRALRWGELRAAGAYPDAMFLAPPSAETRMALKRLSLEGQWEQVREAAEEAAGQPCGRAWLDVQRYAVMACRVTIGEPAAQAIISGLRSLIADFPQMPHWVLADDTAAANIETLQWLTNEMIVAPLPVAIPDPEPAPVVHWAPPPLPPASSPADEAAPPDAYPLAMDAARGGRIEEAFDILTREISQERSGRARFQRRVQLAQVCLATGNQEIAQPILQELSDEIEHRALDAWESADVIAQPLALLYRSLPASPDGDQSGEKRRSLYARICRLDPSQALALKR